MLKKSNKAFWIKLLPVSLRNRLLLRLRIERTIRDRNAEAIPKVAKAGEDMIRNGERVQMMHNGVVVTYGGYHGEWMAEIIRRLRGHHEPTEEFVFHHVVSKLSHNAVMLELGSYWGYYSLWFQSQSTTRKCFLIEPNPKKIDIGRKNFALNGFDATFLQHFISKDSTAQEFEDWDKTILPVSSISIDDFMKAQNLKKIDLLHSDIQGAEGAMLEGARGALTGQSIDYIFLSTHGNQHEICLKKLHEYDYAIVFHHTVQESSSADGLIVACSPTAPTNAAQLKQELSPLINSYGSSKYS